MPLFKNEPPESNLQRGLTLSSNTPPGTNPKNITAIFRGKFGHIFVSYRKSVNSFAMIVEVWSSVGLKIGTCRLNSIEAFWEFFQLEDLDMMTDRSKKS